MIKTLASITPAIGAIILSAALVFASCELTEDSGGDPATDFEAVQAAISALNIAYTAGDGPSSVRKNLTLPATGAHDTSVAWTTSDPVVIAASGAVVRPESGDAFVILTATVRKNAVTASKAFPLTVLAPGAVWARTTILGSYMSLFQSLAQDSLGNFFAAGYIEGTGTYGFGDVVSTSGANGMGYNAVIVKYNSSGTPQWAKSTVTAPGPSEFRAAAVDGTGNVYAAGYIGIGVYDFGNGVTVTGLSGSNNSIIVKYNTSGTPQWARTTVGATTDWTEFYAVAVDTSGDLYAAGFLDNTNSVDFGSGVTVTGAVPGQNALIVKYSPSGTPLWARTMTSGSEGAQYYAVTTDSFGGVFTAGSITGNAPQGFDAGVTVAGSADGAGNILIVKYNSTGNPQWARSTISGDAFSRANCIACDPSGSLYIGGYMSGNGTYGFGSGITAAGPNSMGSNMLLVKYTSAGAPLWARSVQGGGGNSSLSGLKIGADSRIHGAGNIYGAGTFDFGSGITAAGAYGGGNNLLYLRFDLDGTPLRARTVKESTNSSSIISLALNSDGSAVAAGRIYGSGRFDLGNGVVLSGTNSGGNNVLLVKFD